MEVQEKLQNKLILGQYGEEYKYDNNGRISQITYLNKDGKPTSTNLGYTILKRNYYKDGAVKSDRYFDIETACFPSDCRLRQRYGQ